MRMHDRKVKLLARGWIILLLVLVTVSIIFVIVASLGANVLDTFYVIFVYPFKSLKSLSNVINIMTPLTLVGIGICISYRSGFINIGGEGQMTVGLLAALLVGLNTSSWPKLLALPAVLIAGMLGGGLWGTIAGELKTRFKVSELLSTVMLNYAATQLYSYFLRVPLLDSANVAGGGDVQTEKLAENIWLSRMNKLFPALGKNVKFHTGIFIAIVLAVAVYIFLWKTVPGYKMRAAGASERAARYGGIKVRRYVVLAIMLSGMCCGLAAAIEVLGIHHRGLPSITGGYGFSGIVVALFGGLHPIGVLPAAFFFAGISYGCSSLQINKIPLPSNTINVLLGLVILVIVSAKTVMENRYIMSKVEARIAKLLGYGKGGNIDA